MNHYRQDNRMDRISGSGSNDPENPVNPVKKSLFCVAHPPSPKRYGAAGRSLSCSHCSLLTAHCSPSFTIIELLVVISIIAILIGFALPNFLPAREKAKERKAVVTAKNLELAYNEYYNQFQGWPGADGAVQGTLLGALTGTQGIVFFEIGTNTSTTFKDPWDGYYQVAFDADFDNKVNAPGGVTVCKSVIVWSLYIHTNALGVVTITTNKSWE